MGLMDFATKPVEAKIQNQVNNPIKKPSAIFGDPKVPQWAGMTGPGGELGEQFKTTAQPGLAGDFAERLRGTGDISRLRERATAEGLSPQAQLMQQGLSQQAQEQGAGGLASTWGKMAMRGGLSGGGRERLATQSMRGTQRGLQDIGLQTALQDEQQKLGLQQALPGMNLQQEGAILGAGQADIGRQEAAQAANVQGQRQNLLGKRAFDMAKFQEQMKAMGGERAAQAEEAGKK